MARTVNTSELLLLPPSVVLLSEAVVTEVDASCERRVRRRRTLGGWDSYGRERTSSARRRVSLGTTRERGDVPPRTAGRDAVMAAAARARRIVRFGIGERASSGGRMDE